jgi:cellulose synthase/poly-beta-1,6-N-acetylglucosamine synthase-like glycosyltransferase
MGLVIFILKIYIIFEVVIMLIYMMRHFIFTMNRVMGEQRMYYQDIVDTDLPTVSILIPMHNEVKVARHILDLLVSASYPEDKLEIIPINDHSTDKTKKIIDDYGLRYPYIKPLHRSSGKRGKPYGLNDALQQAKGEIIIVFDADYLPSKGAIRDIAISFKDPQVGAVMGRVIPSNTPRNLLTRLLDLERSGGYQVDQQARHNLRLIPQYGGTVGGFRKDVVIYLGGFNPKILAEDTELTFKLFIKGWKVIYANRVECYEEVPENWKTRARQLNRWARGHTQVMFKYLIPLLKSEHLSFMEKMDGSLLLCIYAVPLIILTGLLVSLTLFFLGEMQIVENIFIFLFVAAYNSFGNFAPFFQIGIAALLDGTAERIKLLPMILFSFIFNIFYISKGVLEAIIDQITERETKWKKTERYREEDRGIIA